jgi:hypothetical protein
VRAMMKSLETIRDFTESYVDDMAVYSNTWSQHLEDLKKYLSEIRASGITLNIKKMSLAKGEVKFLGHLIGSGQRRADPDKVATIYALKPAETKKQLRQILGFFSFFRDYIPGFSEVSRPLTDLTSKRVPNRIPWGTEQQCALDKLKELLVSATINPLSIINMKRPFAIHVDASDYAAGGILTQTMEDGSEKPVAFASIKFNTTQRNWATIEKEAFGAIWALNKFRHWVFGRVVTVFTDHNPITYLTESSPKSAKLMRWLLGISEFNVTFKFRVGRFNEAADCVSRMTTSDDETQSV